MASPPPPLPTIASPLGHRKRRHSQVPKDDQNLEDGNRPTNGSNGTADDHADKKLRELGDSSDEETYEDDDEEDDKSLFEELLDTVELQPYEREWTTPKSTP